MKTVFLCSTCKQRIEYESDFTSGYGTDKDGNKHCYACCAEQDKADMRKYGNATLYLTIVNNGSSNYAKVTNWPGTLVFDNLEYRKGKHNITGVRYDVWFWFENTLWHGRTFGNQTQLCHCKRTKCK